MYTAAEKKVLELIDARINGNSIKGNKTYENMLKSVTKKDIQYVASDCAYGLVNGTKLEMIEQIKNMSTGNY